MIDTKAIRSKILDLAMRGKLTEQLPEDGTAEELYRQIQAEKQALIKAGKIKKEKPLPEIAVDEVPFEIPTNWKWVVFGKVITLKSGKDLKPEEYNACENGLPYLTCASNYNENGQLIINRWTEQPKNLAIKGDILLSCKGTVGKLAILAVDRVHIARQFMAIRTYNVNVRFVALFMQSVIEGIKKASKGLIPGIERNDILRLSLPLPPLAEQHRIVARIEQAFSALDTIDALQAKYADNLAVLKSKLIDAAIQGKLTKQLPEDGTAEELYQQIQAEKAKLIKEGKIKKEKPFSTNIQFQDFPFDIPDTWVFVRFGELMISRDSERVPVSTDERAHRAKVYDYYGASGVIDQIDDYLFDKELLLIGEDGANLLARSAPIAFLAHGKYWVNNHAHVLDACTGLDLKYVCYYINAISLAPYVTGTAQPKMNQENMNAIWVPLPPLAEQKRIVEKIEEAMVVCDSWLPKMGKDK